MPKKYLPFVKEFDRWVKKFGLIDWEVLYFIAGDGESVSLEEFDDNDACCAVNYDARVAHIGMHPDIDTSPKYLKKCALHEATELLFADIDWLMKCRYIAKQDIDSARHKVINTLANILGA